MAKLKTGRDSDWTAKFCRGMIIVDGKITSPKAVEKDRRAADSPMRGPYSVCAQCFTPLNYFDRRINNGTCRSCATSHQDKE